METSINDEQLDQPQQEAADAGSGAPFTVLSQEEIDTLLSAYQFANRRTPRGRTDGADDRQVKLYDFAAPNRFSREQLRAIHAIHEDFASALATELAALSSAPARVDIIGIEQLTYKDYRLAISPRTLLAEVVLSQQSPAALFEVNPAIVGVLVDCLCGGSPDTPSSPSELTAMDLAVARNALDACVKAYGGVWPPESRVSPRINCVTDGDTETEYQLAASESVLVCSFEAQLGSSTGMVTLCIPAVTVESLMPAPAGGAVAKPSAADSARKARKALESVDMRCSVELGRAEISLADLTNLEVGDVICTDRRAGAELDVKIGDRCLFRCRPGVVGDRMAVLITGVEDVGGQEIMPRPDSAEAPEAAVTVRPPDEEALPEAA
mgnify:CR=1 FL=1